MSTEVNINARYGYHVHAQLSEMVDAVIAMLLGQREKITVNIRGRLVGRAST